MKIVKYTDISDRKLRTSNCIDGVTFLLSDEHELVKEAAVNVETIKKWFDIVGIKYDNINMIGNRFIYNIGDKQMDLSELSSGERYIIYLLACKKLGKHVIAQGLFERMGSRLEGVIFNNLMDYENLIVVTYNAILTKEFKEYMVEEVQ